jgi:uncharacterized phiE125 gp8 family phage protein
MLDTLANVKTLLMVTVNTDDALLTKLMDGADAYVAQFTGRAFEGGTFTELHPAGHDVVFLQNFPLTTLTSVKVDPARAFGADTVRDPTTYVVLGHRGLIRSLSGPFLPRRGTDWPGAVQVVYATATGAVPPPVKEAFGQLVGHWYRQAKTFADQGQQMLLERTSGTDTKTWSWSLARGLLVPPLVHQLLAPYRVPTM